MKLSSVAVLVGAAIAVFCPGAYAATVSTNELFPEEESFTEMNCANKGNCRYGYNKCVRINKMCDGLCVWSGSVQNGSCKKGVIKKNCKDYKTGNECFAAGCVWKNNTCGNPQQPSAKCRGYTRRKMCVNNGCFWNTNTSTCNNTNRGCRSISNRNECRREGCTWRNNSCREPTNGGGDDGSGTKCIGPYDKTRSCKLNEFCYTRGECSNNASGECLAKPKTFADCSRGKKRFSTFSTSGGNACNSNQFFNSECQAAIAGRNVPRRRNDEVEVSEEFDHEEFDFVEVE